MKRMPVVFSRTRCVYRSALPTDFNTACHILELILEERGFDLISWQTIPPRLCATNATNASGLVLYRDKSSNPSSGHETYAVCAISQIGKRRQQLLIIVPSRIM